MPSHSGELSLFLSGEQRPQFIVPISGGVLRVQRLVECSCSVAADVTLLG